MEDPYHNNQQDLPYLVSPCYFDIDSDINWGT
jgi:hypothetical protein